MFTKAVLSMSRFALVACVFLVAAGPALAVTDLEAPTTAASDLSATTDASPAYGLTIGWDVAKSADQASQTVPVGGAATFEYTVSVTHDAGTPDWE